jgi:homospermidine synthase
LYGLSCCACEIRNDFLYGKTNKKAYITVGTEFCEDECGKNLIINKSVFGLNTPAEDFMTFCRVIIKTKLQKVKT